MVSVASQLPRKHPSGIRTSLNLRNMLMELALSACRVPGPLYLSRESVEIRTANGLSPERLAFLN